MAKTQSRSAQVKGVRLDNSGDGDDVTGVLAIGNGGTGQNAAQAAINALTQVSAATIGDVLTKASDGDAEWAAPSGMPDVAYTEDSTITLNDMFGGTVNLGTGGGIMFRHTRFGRTVILEVYFVIGASPTFGNGGPWYVDSSELPYEPEMPVIGATQFTRAGEFGFYSDATLGMMEGIKPAIANIGSGPALLFVTDPGDGGLGNIFYPGNPIPILEGATYQGKITYEADSAA